MFRKIKNICDCVTCQDCCLFDQDGCALYSKPYEWDVDEIEARVRTLEDKSDESMLDAVEKDFLQTAIGNYIRFSNQFIDVTTMKRLANKIMAVLGEEEMYDEEENYV